MGGPVIAMEAVEVALLGYVPLEGEHPGREQILAPCRYRPGRRPTQAWGRHDDQPPGSRAPQAVVDPPHRNSGLAGGILRIPLLQDELQGEQVGRSGLFRAHRTVGGVAPDHPETASHPNSLRRRITGGYGNEFKAGIHLYPCPVAGHSIGHGGNPAPCSAQILAIFTGKESLVGSHGNQRAETADRPLGMRTAVSGDVPAALTAWQVLPSSLPQACRPSFSWSSSWPWPCRPPYLMRRPSSLQGLRGPSLPLRLLRHPFSRRHRHRTTRLSHSSPSPWRSRRRKTCLSHSYQAPARAP